MCGAEVRILRCTSRMLRLILLALSLIREFTCAAWSPLSPLQIKPKKSGARIYPSCAQQRGREASGLEIEFRAKFRIAALGYEG